MILDPKSGVPSLEIEWDVPAVTDSESLQDNGNVINGNNAILVTGLGLLQILYISALFAIRKHLDLTENLVSYLPRWPNTLQSPL